MDRPINDFAHFFLMFRYPEKATKFEKIFHFKFDGTPSFSNAAHQGRTVVLLFQALKKFLKIFYFLFSMKLPSCLSFFRRIHRREDHSWMVTNSSNLIDCEHESVEENPKMLAFFDSLVQRDLRYYPFIRYHVLRPFYPWCHPLVNGDFDPPSPPNV